jgi:hypothetical protein
MSQSTLGASSAEAPVEWTQCAAAARFAHVHGLYLFVLPYAARRGKTRLSA